MYDEDYIEYHAREVRKDLDELLSMGDSELLKLLEGIPEEETMRALGYTKKEGRTVQGWHTINGKAYNFGNNGTFYAR